ncbi:MAG: DMT family transporter [Candidatus Thermoplasmatota archaeon]
MTSKRLSVGMVLLSSFFWGSSFVAAKIGLEAISPLPYLALRLAIAAPLGGLLILSVHQSAAHTLADRRVWGLGALNALAFAMQYWGLQHTTSTNAALLVTLNVVVVALLSVLVLRERLSLRLLSAVGLGSVGVILVTGGEDLLHGRMGAILRSSTLLGDLLSMGAGVTWAVYIVITKRVLVSKRSPLSPEALAGGVTIATLPPILAVSFFYPWSGATDPLVIGLAGYLALFCTIVAFLLWLKGLKTMSATATSVIVLLELLFAALLGALILSDRLSFVSSMGAALICAAAILSSIEEIRKG